MPEEAEKTSEETKETAKTTETADSKEATTKSEHDQIGYHTRKREEAEKQRDEAKAELTELQKRLKALEDEKLSETERKDKQANEATEEAARLRKETARLQAILEHQLPKELADLVPEGIENPGEYIETKLAPLKEKLTTATTLGNPTNPSKEDVPSEGEKLAKQWDMLVAQGVPEKQLEAFYNEHAEALRPVLSRRK